MKKKLLLSILFSFTSFLFSFTSKAEPLKLNQANLQFKIVSYLDAQENVVCQAKALPPTYSIDYKVSCPIKKNAPAREFSVHLVLRQAMRAQKNELYMELLYWISEYGLQKKLIQETGSSNWLFFNTQKGSLKKASFRQFIDKGQRALELSIH